MRRIGSALAAGAATAGLFGAFALLSVATRPPVEQAALESFAIDADLPDAPVPAAPPAPPAPAAPPTTAAVAAVADLPAPMPPMMRLPTITAPVPMAAAPPVAAPATGSTPATGAPVAAPAAPAAPAPAPPPGGGSSYAARVRAWLLAHKRYPRRSRLQREEGVVRLRFVLDRTGHLLDGALVAGSHHAALDAEALAMLRRAVPYPEPPGDVRGDRIEIAAAIAFELPR